MNSSNSGKKLEGFFTGKGFYIVLFLCAAVIGVSAWMMAAGNETMETEPVLSNSTSLDNKRVETIIIPAESDTGTVSRPDSSHEIEAVAPSVNTEGLTEMIEEEPSEQVDSMGESVPVAATAPLYVWPLEGEIERSYSADALAYDVTMRDWRTHEGLDIAAELGETVYAAHAGLVESIVQDDMYGTVLTVDHGNGTKTVYANLAEMPAVGVGEWIEPGVVIGAVGATALCEIGQGTHLHFAIMVDGVYADPLDYLPA